MATYQAIYQTRAEIIVTVDVPDDLDEFEAEDLAGDRSHALAEEAISTWGIHGAVLLDMSIDGIGAETVERASD